jgi:hypothetical protein
LVQIAICCHLFVRSLPFESSRSINPPP